MAERRLFAKSVEARRFVFMADGSLLAKSVEARPFCFHGRLKQQCKDDECDAAPEARKAITGAKRKL